METYFGNLTPGEGGPAKLQQDFRTLVRDAEVLVRDGCCAMGEHGQVLARQTDRAVRTHPRAAVGIAFGLGLLAGLLLKRK